jgi:uncharacterized protein YbcI
MDDGIEVVAPGLAEQPVNKRIAREISGLLKEFYGRGPRYSRTYLLGDVVLVLLEGGFNMVEETLLQAGNLDAVTTQRAAFQAVMRDRFVGVVEEATGRKVTAFMSANHQHPDLQAEIFTLDGEIDDVGG